MSMVVVYVRFAPALAAELRALETGDQISALLNGDTQRAGFDPKTDIWADADWRDFEAYTGSDKSHPLHLLFEGDPFHPDFGMNYGEPAWIPPETVAAHFAALCEIEGITGDEPEPTFDDDGEMVEDGFAFFPGLLPFLRETVRRGHGLMTGVS